jgi:ascorbate-specific PTS system EIIC-type component UlaA
MGESTNEGASQPTPGRWVGGLVGVVACAATMLVAGAIGALLDPNSWATGNGLLGQDYLAGLALGGLPIAFFGGHALLPAARSGGWLTALGFGFILGVIAPPLGAIEVILVGMLPFTSSTSGFNDNVTGFLILLPIALVYSYVVVVLTVPAGLLWGLMVRAIPEGFLESMDLQR